MNPFSLFLGVNSSEQKTITSNFLALIGGILNLSFCLETFFRSFVFGFMSNFKKIHGFENAVNLGFNTFPHIWLLFTVGYLIGYQKKYRKVLKNLTNQYGTSEKNNVKRVIIFCVSLSFIINACILIISYLNRSNIFSFLYGIYSHNLIFFVTWLIIYSIESHMEKFIENLNSCLVDLKKQNLSQVNTKIKKISKHFSQFLGFFGPLILALIFFNICTIIVMCFYILFLTSTEVNVINCLNIFCLHLISFLFLLFRPTKFYAIVSINLNLIDFLIFLIYIER